MYNNFNIKLVRDCFHCTYCYLINYTTAGTRMPSIWTDGPKTIVFSLLGLPEHYIVLP